MRTRKQLLLMAVGMVWCIVAPAQQQQNILGLKTYFQEAYWRYPNLPKGMLEAAAYAASRITNLQPQLATMETENCANMPLRYGVYALIEDGQGYFKNNLLTVCKVGNITPDDYKNDVRLQILAVAKFLSREASIRQMENIRVSAEAFSDVIDQLCEIPGDSSMVNTYARALYKYDVYYQLQKGFVTPTYKQNPMNVDMRKVFPADLLRKLKAPGVDINYDKDTMVFRTTVMVNGAGMDAAPTIRTVANTAPVNTSTNTIAWNKVAAGDYNTAFYAPANDNNYQSGRSGTPITNITIHTVQGSYAGIISWCKNPNALVSVHYVVRSSDGQITQMVREADVAYHARTANPFTIGIAHEGYMEQGNKWYTDKMYQSSAALVRNICSRWNIDETACYRGMATPGINYLPNNVRIKGHQHYSDNTQTDPGRYWNWTKYANLLQPGVTPVAHAVHITKKTIGHTHTYR